MATAELYVDSSGDLGLKVGRGSSTHVTVVFARLTDEVRFAAAIAALRRSLKLPDTYEYHYTKIRPPIRLAYFAKLRRLEFEAWGVCADKRKIPQEYGRCSSDELLCKLASEVARQIPETLIAGAALVIDDKAAKTKTTQAVRVAVSRVLEERRLERRLAGARGLPAHRHDGLQLADMLAGALRESRAGTGTPDHLAELARKFRAFDLGG